MNPKDYEDYQKNNVKASKSQLKEYIQIYADMAKKLKSESAVELEAVKNNIKKNVGRSDEQSIQRYISGAKLPCPLSLLTTIRSLATSKANKALAPLLLFVPNFANFIV